MTHQVLLYYQFVPIENPETFAQTQRELCERLDLRGRILVAAEGINGTVSGTVEATDAYMAAMHADGRFADMPFKVDESDGHVFPKMKVRVRNEIVTFRADKPVDPTQVSGKRLPPKAFYELLEQAQSSDDVIVIDGRNDYEWDVGHFRNAIRPEVRSFYEFPEWIQEHLKQYRKKKVITYCTGGIRCEKLTAYLLEAGFEDVAQLDGGIVTYGHDPEVRGRLFDGKCYVFDERLVVPVNQEEEVVVGRCHHCGQPTERFINCAYDPCHLQHLCCDDCLDAHEGYCSDDCRTHARAEEDEAVRPR